MEFVEAIQIGRALFAAVKAGDVANAMRAMAKLLSLAADVKDGVSRPAAAGVPAVAADEFDALVVEGERVLSPRAGIEGFGDATPAAADADKAAIDPATILVLVKLAVELFKFIRDRRRGGP